MLLFLLFSLVNGEWVETTQKDFRDGFYECNIYASNRGGGEIEFAPRWDANNDGWIDILSVHVYGGSKIFWGSSKGFSDERETSYGAGIGAGAFADLNLDGFVDLLVTGELGSHIYWGKAGGPDSSNPSELGKGEEACFFADFNKDGYLDIAFDYANPEKAGVYWGSSSGYSDENVKYLPVTQAQHNIEAADINKDGWIDLLLPNQFGNCNTIYWGSEKGFDASKKTDIPYLSSYIHGLSVADLDADGNLDLIFTGNYEIEESWIYWGPGFESSKKTVLKTGECYGGSSVADLNKDGLLDIVFFRGAKTSYRNIIFWGDGNRFKQNISSLFGPESRASGGLIADFNKDGKLDIFFNSYNEASPVLWGPDFSEGTATYLHGGIDHHGISREIGNIYTRQYKEFYYSSVYDTKMDLNWIEPEWEGSAPGKSSVRIAIRTGAHPDDFKGDIKLMSAGSIDKWMDITDNQRIERTLMGCNQRYIQYRLTLEYENPAELPSVSSVKISYEGTPLESPSSVGDQGGLPELQVATNSGYSSWSVSLSSIPSVPVDLAIYDIRGIKVCTLIDGSKEPTQNRFLWSGSDDAGRVLPDGVYFVRLSQSDTLHTAKIVIMR
jgi:hypothetical protein